MKEAEITIRVRMSEASLWWLTTTDSSGLKNDLLRALHAVSLSEMTVRSRPLDPSD